MPLARCVRAVGFPRTAPSPPKPHHNMLRFIACSVSSVCLSSSVFEIPFCDIRDKPADALTERTLCCEGKLGNVLSWLRGLAQLLSWPS